MNEQELSYALAKQLPRAHTIESDYGSIPLDDELREAVEAALRPIIERRLAEADTGEEKIMELNEAFDVAVNALYDLQEAIEHKLEVDAKDEGWRQRLGEVSAMLVVLNGI